MSAGFILLGLTVLIIFAGFAQWILRRHNRQQFHQMTPWTAGFATEIRISDATVFVQKSFEKKISSRPILFLHGLGASSYCWRDLLPLIPAHRSWITIDLPGFGRSSKERNLDYGLDEQARRILEVLDALKISEVDVVGSSLGGALGFWLRSTHSKRFLAYVGISPSITIGGRFSYQAYGWLRKIPLIYRGIPLLRFLLNEVVVYLILTRVRGMMRPLSPDERLRILSPYLDDGTSMICFFKSLELVSDSRLQDAWTSSNLPSALVWGGQDRLMPLKSLTLLQNGKSNVHATVIQRAGHHPMEDAPSEVLTVILKSLESTPLASL